MVGIHHAVKKSCTVGVYYTGATISPVLGRQPPCRFLGCKVDIYHELCSGRLPHALQFRWTSTRNNAVGVYLWFMVLPGSPIFCKVGIYQELSGGPLPSHCGRHPPCSPKFCKVDAHRNAHGSRPPCSLKSCRVDVYHKHCNCGGRLPLDPWWAAQNIAGWASTTHFAVDVYHSVLGRPPPCRFLGCKVDVYHEHCGGRLPLGLR